MPPPSPSVSAQRQTQEAVWEKAAGPQAPRRSLPALLSAVGWHQGDERLDGSPAVGLAVNLQAKHLSRSTTRADHPQEGRERGPSQPPSQKAVEKRN